MKQFFPGEVVLANPIDRILGYNWTFTYNAGGTKVRSTQSFIRASVAKEAMKKMVKELNNASIASS